MSGDVRGRVGIFHAPSDTGDEARQAQALFTNLYELVDSHPNATILALQFGSGGFDGVSTGTPGIGMYDEEPHFMRNAFFLARMEPSASRSFPYYLLIQWSDNDSFGDSPGNPGSIDDSNGADGSVGVAVAMGEGGDDPDFNPWTGSMNGDGSDTKGSTVWAAPAGTVKSGASETFALTDGETLDVAVDGGGAQTATFNTGDFSDINNATAAEVAAVITADITGATAFPQPDGTVIIRTDTRGSTGDIQVTGGTANTNLAFSTTLAAGGDRSHVLPRSSNSGGSRSTNREDTLAIADFSSTQTPGVRAHYIMDDDSLWWAMDHSISHSWTNMGYIGLYDPRPGLTPSFPLIAVRANDDLNRNTQKTEGVVHPRDTTVGVVNYSMYDQVTILTTERQPNSNFSPQEWDEAVVALMMEESPHFGFFGRLTGFPEVYGVPPEGTKSDFSKAWFGNGRTDLRKLVFPWGGTREPKTLSKLIRGIDFVRSP